MPSYRLIQFSVDPIHLAPVNVGVLAWDSDNAFLKLLGVGEGGHFRANVYRGIAGGQPIADEVLIEWLSWFKAMASDQAKLNDDDLSDLDRLIERGCPFSSVNFGYLECNSGELLRVADDLFQKSVLNDSRIRNHWFRDQVLQITEESGLAALPDTYWDAELELLPKKGGGAGLLYFPLFFQGGQVKAAIRLIDFAGDAVAVIQQIADAMAAFETGLAHSVLAPDECIAITSGDSAGYGQHVKWLAGRATLLDIADRPRTIAFFKQLLVKNSL